MGILFLEWPLNEYKTSINQKIYQLKEALPQEDFALLADKQWIYQGRCLVHDFTIGNKFKVSIDTYIDLDGWQIILFARNPHSTNYLFNTMCQKNDFLPNSITEYDRTEKLIYKRFNLETEISEIARTLADLIKRVENYKEEVSQQEVAV